MTPRGRCAAAFSDGEPLIVGTCIADGALQALSCPEVCAWLCLFIPDRSSADDTKMPADATKPSPMLMATVEYANELADQLGKDELKQELMGLMLDWCTHKDIKRIASCIDPALLGSFVKAVMRVLSYIDLVREVLLGLGDYQTHNKLDAHTDALLGGLVTNESLYLHTD
mmetsp:Transcript_11120/g.39127  ORF Transcript_11120/g.39127 Transcript_11120/m.39127 type:complete len:170 (+) Transcript_11120:1371-1880(+)